MSNPLDIICARRSIRSYTDESVSEEHIRMLLETAMSAPSAGNRQPWELVVVTEREKLDALADGHPHGKMLYRAPLCIAVCGDPARSFSGIEQQYWIQDCCAATENLLIAAAGLGLGTVWLGVHPLVDRQEAIRKTLSIPDHIVPLCLIPVGHPAERKAPRTQYDEAKVHWERW